MKKRIFEEIVGKRFQKCFEVIKKKNQRYSPDDDALAHFKKAGRLKGQDPIQAADGMRLKHRVAVDDIIEEMIKNPLYVPTREHLDAKFTDNINYHALIETLIEERRTKLEKQPIDKHEFMNSVAAVNAGLTLDGLEEIKGTLSKENMNYGYCPHCNGKNAFENAACIHCGKAIDEMLMRDELESVKGESLKSTACNYCPTCKANNDIETLTCEACGASMLSLNELYKNCGACGARNSILNTRCLNCKITISESGQVV